jgi:hypothetical protein
VWLRPALFIGLPGAVLVLSGVVLAVAGAELLGWMRAAAGIVTLAVAYALRICATSILAVALFRYAEGRPPYASSSSACSAAHHLEAVDRADPRAALLDQRADAFGHGDEPAVCGHYGAEVFVEDRPADRLAVEGAQPSGRSGASSRTAPRPWTGRSPAAPRLLPAKLNC